MCKNYINRFEPNNFQFVSHVVHVLDLWLQQFYLTNIRWKIDNQIKTRAQCVSYEGEIVKFIYIN